MTPTIPLHKRFMWLAINWTLLLTMPIWGGLLLAGAVIFDAATSKHDARKGLKGEQFLLQ